MTYVDEHGRPIILSDKQKKELRARQIASLAQEIFQNRNVTPEEAYNLSIDFMRFSETFLLESYKSAKEDAEAEEEPKGPRILKP